MSALVQQLADWMQDKEGEQCEFKEAKQNYQFDELVKYGAALANNGGGKIILGVTDERPRRVVGTQAFQQPERTRQGLRERLPLRIDFDEIHHPDGRVLIFHVPSRPIGTPIQHDGIFWSRDGDSLTAMSEDQLRQIFAEGGRDFSADISTEAALSDLEPAAIEDFRRRWIVKSGNHALAALSIEQLLTDAEVLMHGQLTGKLSGFPVLGPVLAQTIERKCKSQPKPSKR
jgi:ATP-dependent DNA helicase RecG